ncbi:HNH endonuclease [Mycobacterium avium subsp. hominissuis]|uniref:HNH endonuclease n=5 Tax=Mycobacterium avium complex (MAC) TaxID=120793 RepID=A0A2A3L916_MYCAV|nr:HNH endonuclease [Mycobacterium avium subsp. hominissuis]MBG0729608.1 HNH endonuclease [Mycobacterium avium]MCV6990608.1 HNH endonuclease [Mycobacterium bouchedurhonense]MCV6996033.1 HNH endonuclease [Mycobacterium timonense]AXO23182.1 HNH endonuclease [Mycobacterium avium subsp. hominissuis]
MCDGARRRYRKTTAAVCLFARKEGTQADAWILARDKHRCQLRYTVCTLIATHVDHIIEAADGGDNSDSSVQAACADCHRVKTGRDARARQLAAKPPPAPRVSYFDPDGYHQS